MDRLAKVRAEIEKCQKQIQAGAVDNRISKENTEAYRICVKLISIIDSMQEESGVIDCARKQPLSYGKEELVNNGLDLGCGVIWKQEPVSEDLEKAASRYAKEEYNHKIPATLPDRCRGCYAPLMYAFKAGAQWQKQQFEKNRLKHCNSITNEQAELEQGFIDQHLDKYNRMPTFLDAFEYGMRLQKEQMMTEAMVGAICEDRGGYLYAHVPIPFSKSFSRLDKIKALIIKED